MPTHFPVQLAQEAIILNDYAAAFDLLAPEAQRGDPQAQFLYAYLHFLNPDLTQADALALMQRAAEQGHAEANYMLAVCPTLAINQDEAWQAPTTPETWQHLERAAQLGSLPARVELGKAYYEGQVVPQDLDRAAQLLSEDLRSNPKRRTIVSYPEVYYQQARVLLAQKGRGKYERIRDALYYLRYCWELVAAADNPFIERTMELATYILHKKRFVLTDAKIADTEARLAKLRANQPYPRFTRWQAHMTYYVRYSFEYDLCGVSFEAFISFVFDHLLVDRDKPWTYIARVHFDAPELLQHYQQLFANPIFLLDEYPVEKLRTGFWAIMAFNTWNVRAVLSHASVPLADAEKTIRLMYDLYARLFVVNPIDDCGYMWWEDPMYYFNRHGSDPHLRKFTRAAQKPLLKASVETLTKILQLDSVPCQIGALHGLGHLQHPNTERIIMAFLAAHPETELREYALAAIEDKIL